MWSSLTSPRWLARALGLVGLMTVVSALIPAFRTRLDLVLDVLPPAFPAAATTGALGLGIVLILLSGSLRRGKRRAWYVAVVAVGVTMVLHLVKGLDVEEALVSGVLLVLLIGGHRHFTARPDPRSWRRVVAVVVAAPLVATALGWAWLAIDADGEAPGTTGSQLLQQALIGLVGVKGPVTFVADGASDRATVALAVLGVAVVVVVVLALLQPADGPRRIDDAEEAQIRQLLARWGKVDSLSYFATRRDRSVLFSKSGKAAVSYRSVGGVCLAAGDPLGDPEAWPGAIEAWLEQSRSYGWVPAVLGASDRGAVAYSRAGLDAFELGDEAVLEVDTWSLDGRNMRSVRQAVSRCARAGLVVETRRVTDLGPDERDLLVEMADRWRDGEVERGFSMALDRFADQADGTSIVVTARTAEGDLQGLLSFAPWGDDGLSLDMMRRDKASENGLIEYLVVGLMEQCPELGVRRLSLNFAVFRQVFARGERLGAGPVQRLTHAVLLGASRFWQIESLYRANAKYQPEWHPRYLCFESAGDLTRVGVAALRAEAFIVAPRWWTRLRSGRRRGDAHEGAVGVRDEESGRLQVR